MVRIREAFPIDTEAIVEVTASGWRAAYPGIVPARHLRDLPISTWRHDVRSGLRAPEGDSFTRIADLDGVVAGYCYVAAPAGGEPEGSRIAELVAIYVEPEEPEPVEAPVAAEPTAPPRPQQPRPVPPAPRPAKTSGTGS